MLRTIAKNLVRRLSANSYQPLNRIELDAAAVVHNMAWLAKQHSGFQIIPVLKGNAYGHGVEEMAAILNRAACSLLAVDGYFEASKIRGITKHRILVMGCILPRNVHLLDTKRCSFVVQDIAGLRAFGALHKPVRIHVEINTGMNRLGLQQDEIAPYLAEFKRHPNLTLEGVMTHLADADNEVDDSYTVRQVEQFDKAVEDIRAAGFEPTVVHVAQTAGSAKVRSRHANALRLGIGLYGINPLSPKDAAHTSLAGLRPVLELKSTIIKVLDVQKGEKISYNGIFTAPKAMRIGVLPLGYYEAVPRELSNKGCVMAKGRRLPIVGRICMNHTMVDVSGTSLTAYDEVTVISRRPDDPNSVADIVAEQGLFSYTVLTGLSSSVRRIIM